MGDVKKGSHGQRTGFKLLVLSAACFSFRYKEDKEICRMVAACGGKIKWKVWFLPRLPEFWFGFIYDSSERYGASNVNSLFIGLGVISIEFWKECRS